jgi:hypothetical protein
MAPCPRLFAPWLPTSNFLPGVKILVMTMSVGMIIMHYRVFHRPLQRYMTIITAVMMLTGIWYRAFSTLKRLERQHQAGEPTEAMILLFDLCISRLSCK